jgi:hypothetical protein
MTAFGWRQRAAKAERSGFPRPERAESKAAAAYINGHFGKSHGHQSSKQGRWGHGNKRAPNVSHAMQPTILNFKGKKNTARPEDPKNFRESAILQFAGTQVVKHQDRDGRRKTGVCKRKRCRIAPNHYGIGAVHLGAEFRREWVVILKTCHSRGPQRQFVRRHSWARTQFQ